MLISNVLFLYFNAFESFVTKIKHLTLVVQFHMLVSHVLPVCRKSFVRPSVNYIQQFLNSLNLILFQFSNPASKRTGNYDPRDCCLMVHKTQKIVQIAPIYQSGNPTLVLPLSVCLFYIILKTTINHPRPPIQPQISCIFFSETSLIIISG